MLFLVACDGGVFVRGVVQDGSRESFSVERPARQRHGQIAVFFAGQPAASMWPLWYTLVAFQKAERACWPTPSPERLRTSEKQV